MATAIVGVILLAIVGAIVYGMVRIRKTGNRPAAAIAAIAKADAIDSPKAWGCGIAPHPFFFYSKGGVAKCPQH